MKGFCAEFFLILRKKKTRLTTYRPKHAFTAKFIPRKKIFIHTRSL